MSEGGGWQARVAGVSEEKRAIRAQVRRRRRERREIEPRPLEGAAIAAGVLAHLDTCPQAAARGWRAPGERVPDDAPDAPDTRGTRDTRGDVPDSPDAPDQRDHPAQRDHPDPAIGRPSVAVFRSTPGEPSTLALIAALHDRGVRVLVPRTLPDLDLDWHEVHASHAAGDGPAPGPAGVVELPDRQSAEDEGPSLGVGAIEDAIAVIVPGLAVDGDGHRLGQGGGCYDRTLPRLRPGTCHAVLLFDDELLDAVPNDAHDRVVPAVLTPRRGWTALRHSPTDQHE